MLMTYALWVDFVNNIKRHIHDDFIDTFYLHHLRQVRITCLFLVFFTPIDQIDSYTDTFKGLHIIECPITKIWYYFFIWMFLYTFCSVSIIGFKRNCECYLWPLNASVYASLVKHQPHCTCHVITYLWCDCRIGRCGSIYTHKPVQNYMFISCFVFLPIREIDAYTDAFNGLHIIECHITKIWYYFFIRMFYILFLYINACSPC